MAGLRSSLYPPTVFTGRPQLSHDKSVGAGWQTEDYVIVVGMSHQSGSAVCVAGKGIDSHSLIFFFFIIKCSTPQHQSIKCDCIKAQRSHL